MESFNEIVKDLMKSNQFMKQLWKLNKMKYQIKQIKITQINYFTHETIGTSPLTTIFVVQK